jgi:hypothetical protein
MTSASATTRGDDTAFVAIDSHVYQYLTTADAEMTSQLRGVWRWGILHRAPTTCRTVRRQGTAREPLHAIHAYAEWVAFLGGLLRARAGAGVMRGPLWDDVGPLQR